MGARPEDYERSAPYRSYIHVDEFESPRELAGYLHRLDKNDDLYNSYFRFVYHFFIFTICLSFYLHKREVYLLTNIFKTIWLIL